MSMLDRLADSYFSEPEPLGKKEIPVRTIVRNVRTNKMGVVIPKLVGPFGGGDDVDVIYEGDACAINTSTGYLEVVGPESARADLRQCGAGKGKQCCIFLVSGPDGPQCERFGERHWSYLLYRHTEEAKNARADRQAERIPTALFPNCQLVE